MYEAKIIADSVNPSGNRITTFELSYPRMVHAELMTHRMFSRNSASSRAIPTPTLVERIQNDPVMPKWWGKNQSGMQAREELEGDELDEAQSLWLLARDQMLVYAETLREIGLHKQIANRILEPWMFITVIVTATEYDNWFHLRDSEFAQPEIAWVAREMRKLYREHEPQELAVGQWHLPYVDSIGDIKDGQINPLWVNPREPEIAGDPIGRVKISAARCARVSYLTHDGIRDLSKDLELHDKLTGNGHWSPFEHPAQALATGERVGNFYGWRQYRKFFSHENYGRHMR
jgi:thymidylate synthase ThyX